MIKPRPAIYVPTRSRLAKCLDEIFVDRYTCIFCGREMPDPDRLGTCETCKKTLPKIGEAVCLKCGKPILAEEGVVEWDKELFAEGEGLFATSSEEVEYGTYCYGCRKTPRYFDQVRSAFCYNGAVQKVVHQSKFGYARYKLRYMAGYLADAYLEAGWPVDGVTCVPVTAKVRRQRGYNHAEELAKDFCMRLGLPYMEGLTKVKDTAQQAQSDYKSRRENLKGAFHADKEVFKGKRVLVVDDVLTTGSTMDEVARTLRKAGAVKVYGVTFANVEEK